MTVEGKYWIKTGASEACTETYIHALDFYMIDYFGSAVAWEFPKDFKCSLNARTQLEQRNTKDNVIGFLCS